MPWQTRLSAGIACVFAWLLGAAACLALDVPPRPERYVVDLAGIVERAVQSKLNGLLKELEQKTTAQFIVLTVKSLQGESIEAAAIAVAHDKWKLGQRGKDNGVLLLISSGDRKYRVEVGYGLEGVLPDSLVGSLGRDYLVPYFKKGDYASGIFAAAAAIAKTIADDAGVQLSGMPKLEKAPHRNPSKGPLGPFIPLILLGLVFMLFIRNPRAFLLFLLFSRLGGRNSWGGGSRGGFGGGGFGSFGGGGGGGFGGGGASGSW